MKRFKIFVLLFLFLGHVTFSIAHWEQSLSTMVQKGLVLGTIMGLGLYAGLKTNAFLFAKNEYLTNLIVEEERTKRYDPIYIDIVRVAIQRAGLKRALVGGFVAAGSFIAALKLSKFSIANPTLENAFIAGILACFGGYVGQRSIHEIFDQPKDSETCFSKTKVLYGIALSGGLLSSAAWLAYKK